MTARADRAQELINDPLLKEAFNTVREHYRDMIEELPLASDKIEPVQDLVKMLHLLHIAE